MLSCGHAYAFWKLLTKQKLEVTFDSDKQDIIDFFFKTNWL